MRRVEGYLPGTGIVRLESEGATISSVAVVEPVEEWRPDLCDAGVVLPGMVDLQVNGYRTIDFGSEELSTDDVLTVARELWQVGVVGFCPTIITAPLARMAQSLRVLDDARGQPVPEASSVLGAHVEGPWISPLDGARGAHPLDHVAAPDPAAAGRLLDAGSVAIVTVAPELPGILDLITVLRDRGVLVSIGHSASAADLIAPAVDRGAVLSTHLGNGVPKDLRRHPNLIWEQLADDRLTGMFIADLHHLDPTTLRAMVRAKGETRIVLVSDTTMIAGMPPGRYETWIGGEVELSTAGRLTIVGTPYLAGAALPLIAGLSNVLRLGIMSARAAVSAVTRKPEAMLAGNGAAAPPFRVGDPATFLLCSWGDTASLLVHETVVGGMTVWSR